MTVPAIHEDDAVELGLPGRRMRWLVSNDAVKANNCSVCVIRVAPGEKVTPAHSLPNGEEVIYNGRSVVMDSTTPLGGAGGVKVHVGLIEQIGKLLMVNGKLVEPLRPKGKPVLLGDQT